MAVEGDALSGPLPLGSEDWIEYPCSLCKKDGKNIASIKHCPECGENLCKTCHSYHEKFTSGHQIVDKLSAELRKKKPDLPVQRCEKHGGKLVDVYCPGHDAVGCATCVAVDHSSCKDKQFIPDVVKTTSIEKQCSKLQTRMKQLLTRLDKMKNENKYRLQQLQKEKEDILYEIRNLRTKINNYLDKMEKKLASDVESRFAGKIQSTIQCGEAFDNIASSVAKSRKILQEARNVNDVEIFVRVKQENKNFRGNKTRLKQLSSESDVSSIKLSSGKLQEDFFREEDNIFGCISEILIPKSIDHIGNFSVRLQSDKESCDIGDLCLTAGGSVVCTDCGNNQVKKLDSSYNVIEHLDLPESPASLCEVDSTQLAVTLINVKNVQFVSQQPLKLGRSFTVGDCCRGIECHGGQLYVCCGGFDGEGQGHIEVYDINGGLLRTHYEGLWFPNILKTSGIGKLFINDILTGKLYTFNTYNFSLSEIQTRGLCVKSGFCRIGDSQLFITGYDSNNIMLISEDGKHQQELLTKDNGVVKPWAVCFDEKQSRLIVSLDGSDVIKVFRVVNLAGPV